MYDIVEQSTEEGERLYDSNRLTIGDVTRLEQPDVEDAIHLRIGFWKAYNRLSDVNADVISMLMSGYKFKDISELVHNARYRIRIARKRFREELDREGVNV
jgi:hypothetical protein